MDYYRVMGLEPKLQLDSNELQQIFYRRSRELHPDRFARAAADVQKAALEESSLLNDAYRTLREPVKRAEYFLKNHGFDIGTQSTKDVPPELLEQVFEMNMALEEWKSGDVSARPQLEQAQREFDQIRQELDGELEALFAAHDRSPEEATRKAMRALLNKRRYIENLLRDVNGYLSN